MGLKGSEQKKHQNRYRTKPGKEAIFVGEIYIKYTQVIYDCGYRTRFSDQSIQHGALQQPSQQQSELSLLEDLLYASHYLKYYIWNVSFNLQNKSQRRFYYYTHSIDGKSEAQTSVK